MRVNLLSFWLLWCAVHLLCPSISAAQTATQVPERPAALFCAQAGETPSLSLVPELEKRLRLVQPGPLQKAAGAVKKAQTALASLRCSEAVPALRQAGEDLLAEAPWKEAQPVSRDVFGLLLVCADRIGDAENARRAAQVLLSQKDPLPADVSLVLARHDPGAVFGPMREPVWVETDPAGALVFRNAEPVGPSPVAVPGGRTDADVLTVVSPGMRNVRLPLGSGGKMFLSLRPEDRLPVLLDPVAALPLGSEEQGKLLAQLAQNPVVVTQLGRHLLLFGPKERQGKPVEQEPLVARVYDFQQRAFLLTPSDIAIGPPPAQTEALLALFSAPKPTGAAQTATASTGTVPSGTAPIATTPGAATAKSAPADNKSGSKLPFAKTRWYTWVSAGGVAALIAGLLIAERFSSEKITVTATH